MRCRMAPPRRSREAPAVGLRAIATHKGVGRQDLSQLLRGLGIIKRSWVWDQQTLLCSGSSTEWGWGAGPDRCPPGWPSGFSLSITNTVQPDVRCDLHQRHSTAGRRQRETEHAAPCAQGWQCPLGCGVTLRAPVAKDRISHPLPPCPHHPLPLVPGVLQPGPSPCQKRVVSSTVCQGGTEV